MKKIISLLLVTVMMFALAVSVSADVAKGINVHFDEDKDGIITATISAVGLESLSAMYLGIKPDTTKVTLLKNDKTTAVDNSALAYTEIAEEVDSVFIGWGNSGKAMTWKNSAYLITTGTTGTVNVDSSTGSKVLYKLYFKKIAGQTIDSDTFKMYYNAMQAATSFTNAGTQIKFNSTNAATSIAFTVTPYVAPVTGWTETDGTTTVTVKFPTSAAEKAGAESSWTGNLTTQATKKAVKFGKNETGAKMLGATVSDGKLVVNNPEYYVEYNGEKYYGLIDVEAGKSWAILIIESAN